MTNKKRRAFTLVELLAVIILLGVIAIIITPNILRLQKKTSRETFEESINALLRSAQIYHANNNFLNYPSNGIAANSSALKAKNNDVFTNGMIKIIDNNFFAENVSDGKYCASGMKNDLYIAEGKCPDTPLKCFTFDENTATITKYNKNIKDCNVANPTVPNEINGVRVRNIGTAAFANYEIFVCSNNDFANTVYVDNIEDTQKYNSCFASTENLDKTDYDTFISVTLPATIEKIEDMAFANNDIKVIDFQNLPLLNKIGNGAFDWNNLSIVDLSKNKDLTYVGDNAFYDNQITTLNISGLNKLTSIGYEAFAYNDILKVDISDMDELTSIKKRAFYDNQIQDGNFENLPKLEIIDEHAFYYNEFNNLTFKNLEKFNKFGKFSFAATKISNLKFENLPSLTEIGESSFRDNNISQSITFINLPNLVKIGYMTFHSSFVYTSISTLDLSTLPKLEKLDTNAFAWNNFVEVKFPLSIKHIGPTALRGYGKLSTTNLSELKNLTFIGGHAFYYNSFVNLVIPENVTTIESLSFATNTPYKSIVIKGTDPTRFNATWTNIGFPNSLKPI